MRISKRIIDEHPLVNDIQEQYVNYRKNGMSRSEAVDKIRQENADELQDFDERYLVLIGLSLALCKKNEMIKSLADETLDEIRRVSVDEDLENAFRNFFANVEQCLKDESVYGEEAPYKKSAKYVPDWKVGDVFIHQLTHPKSIPLGINGWFVIFYKVGEYCDMYGDLNQLMCISLCPPDKTPTCDSELQALGFLCMMGRENPKYLSQMTIKSKKAENYYELTKIGNFLNVYLPASVLNENPVVAVPLFGYSKWDAPLPAYEDYICGRYKECGQKLNR